MNIILCGLPKCGKTSVGKKLALQLGWKFIDTDVLIENSYLESEGKAYTCRELLREVGEKKFRELEAKQIVSLKGVQKSVIALGGGSFYHPKSGKMLSCLGEIIYLKIDLNLLWERILKTGQPSYLDSINPKAAFYNLAQTRNPIYEKFAKFVVEITDQKEQDVYDEVYHFVKVTYGK